MPQSSRSRKSASIIVAKSRETFTSPSPLSPRRAEIFGLTFHYAALSIWITELLHAERDVGSSVSSSYSLFEDLTKCSRCSWQSKVDLPVWIMKLFHAVRGIRPLRDELWKSFSAFVCALRIVALAGSWSGYRSLPYLDVWSRGICRDAMAARSFTRLRVSTTRTRWEYSDIIDASENSSDCLFPALRRQLAIYWPVIIFRWRQPAFSCCAEDSGRRRMAPKMLPWKSPEWLAGRIHGGRQRAKRRENWCESKGRDKAVGVPYVHKSRVCQFLQHSLVTTPLTLEISSAEVGQIPLRKRAIRPSIIAL